MVGIAVIVALAIPRVQPVSTSTTTTPPSNQIHDAPVHVPVLGASPNPSSSAPSANPPGSSSASTFSCDYLTGTCTPDPTGQLTNCDACEKKTYYCDPASWSCRDVGFLRDSAARCRQSCAPDLRIRGNYTAQRSDTNADGSGAFCSTGRFREASTGTINGTNLPAYQWTDMSCVGYRCCSSHYCDPSGVGQDPYSVSVCPDLGTETTCTGAMNRDVPAYCEWTGSACQASTGVTSACAACTVDSDCPGNFGAFQCTAGVCVAQGQPKCDVIEKEYRTEEVIPAHMRQACTQLFNKDRDTIARLCADVTDGDVCMGTYFDRACVDRYGKTWLTERSHCGARTAPAYPTIETDDV